MAVNIGELTTEVVPEVGAGEKSSTSEPTSGWEEMERVRAAQAQLHEDRLRTHAGGGDD